MQLVNIKTITANLECQTGAHVGASDSEIHIGGVDSQVIKNPITLEPYLPGSSLKGKMRSLLEWRTGAIQDGAPLSWDRYKKEDIPEKKEAILKILQLFGAAGSDQLGSEEAKKLGPTRASFWDCNLNKDWNKKLDENNLLFTEVKSENAINRITAAANPRFQERVPAGTVFDFRLSLKCLENDKDTLLNLVLEGMKLMELDGIGGSVSRGYGKIKFTDIKINGEKYADNLDAIKPFGK